MSEQAVRLFGRALDICESTIAQFCSNAVWIDVKPEFDTIKECVKRIQKRVKRGHRVRTTVDDKWLD